MEHEAETARWRRRAEWALQHPQTFRARGRLRVELDELAAEAQRELARAELELEGAILLRRAALKRLRHIGRAISGTGQVDGQQVLPPRRVDDSCLPPERATETQLLAGAHVGQAVLEVLRTAGRPLMVSEIVRLLEASGYAVPGRASQTVSNALRAHLRAGTAVRTCRGWYEAAS